jgi:hypothetical protein
MCIYILRNDDLQGGYKLLKNYFLLFQTFFSCLSFTLTFFSTWTQTYKRTFVIKGSISPKFLDDKLLQLGFNYCLEIEVLRRRDI